MPRIVRTLHGRGYRFVAAVEEREHVAADVNAPPSCRPPSLVGRAVPPVGREAELTCLHAWLARALQSVRQVVFVTGEVGLGKTTLGATVVAQLGDQGRLGDG